MTDPARYWPGGIPACIQFHPEPILSAYENHAKAWQLFLQENAVAPPAQCRDENFEVNQRRKLMERWATLSQDARDTYDGRAPKRKANWYPEELKGNMRRNLTNSDFCNCVVEYPLSPRNWALWTKMRILLYHLEGEDGPQFDTAVLEPNAAIEPRVVTPDSFFMFEYAEAARFDCLAMTRQGTIFLHQSISTCLFVDQEALETGRLLLCDIENNGSVVASGRGWPIYTHHVYCMVMGLGKPVTSLVENGCFGDEYEDIALDMEKSILDILEDMKPGLQGGIDEWIDDIERYAPGYLDMEEALGGMVTDYDHENFRSMQQLIDIPRASS
ncbi:hypothetical protein F5Y15DRAFT_365855 [Xylariaceae sp. FL0016]|nr:hypothetical protein F5Y15DRAFT_365855 [Xylariaceae sp. FL0016]